MKNSTLLLYGGVIAVAILSKMAAGFAITTEQSCSITPRMTSSVVQMAEDDVANPNSPDTYVRCGKCQTSYALAESELGSGRGRRLQCGTCGHTWFQSHDRLMTVEESFELVPLPEVDRNRIALNLEEGKSPKFMGECKLYVGNIAFASNEEELYELFSKIGVVGDVSLVRDDMGRNRGFGFVTMRTQEEGDKAIGELDGTELNGRNLAVRASNN